MRDWKRVLLVSFLGLALALPLAPRQAEAWFFGFFARIFFSSGARSAAGGVARGLAGNAARTGFRQLARGGGRQLIRARARAATRAVRQRAVAAPKGQLRMQRLFGKKPYVKRGANGQITRSATVEGDLLIFREAGRKVGFAQWEKQGLILYRADGRRVARLLESDNRVLAYDNQGNYLGQFIEEVVEDQISRYFVDALGQRHETMSVPPPKTETSPSQKRFYSHAEDGSITGYSMLVDGMLVICAPDGTELARGVWEESSLVLYDLLGEKQGEFRREGDTIMAYDAKGNNVGYIAEENGQAVFRAS